MKIYADMTNDEIDLIYKNIANNIKHIRTEKKLTQTYVALSMGFSTATFYTNAENCSNGKHFNLEHLIKLSQILDTDLANFFN